MTEKNASTEIDLIVVGRHTSESVRGLLRETGARLVELRSFESLDAIEWNILTIVRHAPAGPARLGRADLLPHACTVPQSRPYIPR